MLPPNSARYISDLIQEISLEDTKSNHDILNQSEARVKTLVAAKRLIVALEKPEESIQQNAFLPAQSMCVRIAVDLNVFNIIAENKDMPITASEIAEQSGASKLLIVRIMRVISSIKFVDEVAIESYAANAITKAMSLPKYKACVKFFYDQALPANAKLPEYFQLRNYQCPTDPKDGPYQYAFGTDLETFHHWTTQPEVYKNFNILMTGSKGSKPSWVSWFPVKQHLLSSVKIEDETLLLVDIGGGKGTEISAFKHAFPDLKGRLILQDLPQVVKDAAELENYGIERMVYDFFTRQPIKGALFYYFHFVLHDWPDHDCVEILKNTLSAMGPHSRIILNEMILPDVSCPLYAACLDLNMMTLHSGMERSEKQWRDLLHSSGLEIVKFWHNPGEGEGIIEAIPMKTGSINGVVNGF